MKLSWLSTSEAHTNKHINDMAIWCNAQSKRERELEIMDQSQIQVICFEVRATALRPCLNTENFSLSRPHRTSHTWSLHWRFGAIQSPGVHNSSLNQYNLLLEARHKANTNQPHKWGIGTKPPLQQSTSTQEGYHKLGGFTTWWFSQPQTNSFSQNKYPNR